MDWTALAAECRSFIVFIVFILCNLTSIYGTYSVGRPNDADICGAEKKKQNVQIWTLTD